MSNPDKPPQTEADRRQMRLAQALRANLKRRKAPAPASPKPRQTSTD